MKRDNFCSRLPNRLSQGFPCPSAVALQKDHWASVEGKKLCTLMEVPSTSIMLFIIQIIILGVFKIPEHLFLLILKQEQ